MTKTVLAKALCTFCLKKVLAYQLGKNWVKSGQKLGKSWAKTGQTLADNSTSISNNNIKKEKDIDGEGERVRGQPPPTEKNLCSEKVRLCWIKNSGVNPNDGIREELGELEKKHGTEKVELAIKEANYSDDGGGINLNFVISKLNKMICGKKGEQKEDESNEYAGIW